MEDAPMHGSLSFGPRSCNLGIFNALVVLCGFGRLGFVSRRRANGFDEQDSCSFALR